MKAFLSPSFQLAVEDDYIVKNPFLFKLNKIIEDDRKERTSISVEKEQEYLDYVKNNAYFKKSYPDIVILLKTGMRVSELYGFHQRARLEIEFWQWMTMLYKHS